MLEWFRGRAVAQLGSALEWGSRGPAFKSRQPDQLYLVGIHQFPPIERDPLIQMSLATRSFFIKCAMGIQT
jgi:hypothetical protein